MSYNKIREIVTKNPDITAEEFDKELKKRKIDKEIIDQNGWTLFYYAVRAEGPSITGDRSIFLKIVELFTNLNIGIDFKDTASKTVLGMAAVNKQADVVKILLSSGKFDEEEKLNALNSAIIQGNIQEAKSFLGYIKYADVLKALNALETTISNKKQIEVIRQFFTCNKDLTEQEKVQVLSDAVMGSDVSKVKLVLDYMVGIPEASKKDLLEKMKQRQLLFKEKNNTFCSKTNAIILLLKSAVNKDETLVVTAPPILTKKTNPTTAPNSEHHNNENKTPVATEVVTTSSIEENRTVPSISNGSVSNKPVSPVVSTNAGTPVMSSSNNEANGFTNAQFSRPNEKETKHKESKENFYASLRNDVVGVVITGLFIAAAVMIPSVAGAVVCGVVAVLVAVCTGLHVKNSTLPSYREMEENKVEPISQGALTP